jgi:NADH:ubiquinone oxidoreductase subunit F (NADH-binding)
MMAVTVDQLLPRLLAGIGERSLVEFEQHMEVHGPPPDLRRTPPEQIINLVETAGLRGHGGAGFPMARKMRAVAARRRQPVVVANGSEGEPASRKDRVLLRETPHLVLDGAAAAARAVGAREVIVAISSEDQRSLHSLDLALRDRGAARLRDDPRFELFEVQPGYVSGQETALVSALNGGLAKPQFAPPLPYERGVRGRPTLIQNVETLAHLALLVRRGVEWFRELGTPRDPGSALVTVSGALAAPGVYEIEHGMPLSELLEVAGLNERLSAVLIGGYFGTWLPAEVVPDADLSSESLGEYGAVLGAGVIVALGADACPVAETTRIVDWFAAESAGQCGPCVNGLGAIADVVHRLATGTADRAAWSDLERWTGDMHRRGACQHPDGAIRFTTSALQTFDAELRDHARRGMCERCGNPPVLPTPSRASVGGRA